MIASIKGTLVSKGADYVVVETGGVGFQIFVPAMLLDELDAIGTRIQLITYLYVRENELSLYGFSNAEERELFEMLLGVSRIGPRVALNAMSTLPAETLRDAIAQSNISSLTQIPGIGKKVAQRLVLDLQDKVGPPSAQAGPVPFSGITAAEAEVVAGLTSLGYSVAEAQEAVQALPDEKLELEEQIRLALQYLGGNES
jgi:Holliday junction DNA helicase RuvA